MKKVSKKKYLNFNNIIIKIIFFKKNKHFYYLKNSIFFNTINQESKVLVDPFRPSELIQKSTRSLTGASVKVTVKSRRPSRIFQEIKSTLKLNTLSLQKKQTNQ